LITVGFFSYIMQNKEITLLDDCRATLIPAGNPVVLPKGSHVSITQALGGSITVRHDQELFHIDEKDLEALGVEAADLGRQSAPPPKAVDGFGEETVWEALKSCFDPEIPLNIVDLGLIYDLSLEDAPGGCNVKVKMTLTAQGCGMGPAIASDAKAKIEALLEVSSAEVEIVWDPQWTPHMMSPKGRKVLGLD